MKKIGIITFHRALNYGAVLQAYALSEKLKEITGEDSTVEIVDYRSSEIEKGRSIKQRITPITIKNLVRGVMLYNKTKKFNSFMEKNISESSKVYNSNNIQEVGKDFDLVIAGSDQIWNHKITKNDYTYMLDIKMPKEKKCSYAASLGLTEIESTEVEKYKKVLNDLSHISVRENEGRNILENQLNIKADGVHLDPTLLLTGEDWKKLAKTSNENKKYILVYNVPKPNKLFEVATEISKQTGYKLIYIPTAVKPKNGKIIFPSVEQFLGLFANAQMVITNSFHGTVFAIQFHKKLLVELKEKGTGNDRIKTLLSACNLTDHILTNENHKKIFDDINWDDVENKLSACRQDSIEYLKNITK